MLQPNPRTVEVYVDTEPFPDELRRSSGVLAVAATFEDARLAGKALPATHIPTNADAARYLIELGTSMHFLPHDAGVFTRNEGLA